SWVY
ncbi:hypothetical protein D049_1960B, partial [Vibrio parahaemolyticus VPTS-2010]